MNKINYIPAFYIGNRVHTDYNNNIKQNPLILVEKHIEALKNTEINLVSFVFNLDDLSIANELEDKIKKYNINFNYECIFRQNMGCSYGAWNDVIIKNLDDFDYFFIIEDDFIPTNPEFYKPFVQRCSDKYPYICEFTDVTWTGLPHPSIPHGIIQAKSCREIYKKYKNILKIYNDNNNLETFYKIQRECFEYFINENFGIKDILDEYSAPFMSSPTRQITIFGNPSNPSLLTPVTL